MSQLTKEETEFDSHWKVASASVVGSSHISSQTECQDSHFVILKPNYLLLAVADGAGSANHSKEGSQLACLMFRDYFEQKFDLEPNSIPIKSDFERFLAGFQEEVNRRANERNLQVREFSTTFLGGVITHDRCWFFQVGDGAIVIRKPDSPSYECVFWPENGEYANTTFFLTQANSLDHSQFVEIHPNPVEVALFSDGLQRLALNMLSKSPHDAFFQAMLNPLRTIATGISRDWSDRLATFLDSSEVNSRTDDDKTLLLATSIVAPSHIYLPPSQESPKSQISAEELQGTSPPSVVSIEPQTAELPLTPFLDSVDKVTVKPKNKRGPKVGSSKNNKQFPEVSGETKE